MTVDRRRPMSPWLKYIGLPALGLSAAYVLNDIQGIGDVAVQVPDLRAQIEAVRDTLSTQQLQMSSVLSRVESFEEELRDINGKQDVHMLAIHGVVNRQLERAADDRVKFAEQQLQTAQQAHEAQKLFLIDQIRDLVRNRDGELGIPLIPRDRLLPVRIR